MTHLFDCCPFYLFNSFIRLSVRFSVYLIESFVGKGPDMKVAFLINYATFATLPLIRARAALNLVSCDLAVNVT